MKHLPKLVTAIGIMAGTWTARAHEGFLPLHEHNPASHEHGAVHEHHSAQDPDHKHVHEHHAHSEERWAVAAGARYTRYSLDGARAELWESGLGFDFAATDWLHIGGDFSYGWFDSEQGDTSGWLMPHAHVDVHLPFREGWELLVGASVGFPGGDEALSGEHWEWEPHLELMHDRGAWYVRAGVGFLFVTGDSHDHQGHAHGAEEEADEDGHDEEHEGEHEEAAPHAEANDFHDVVHPHGERELNYYGAFGVRLFDERLTLEARLSGVHVFSDDTPAEDYVRAGILCAWKVREHLSVTAQASVPITDAERNEVQASVGIRVAF